jgi:signal transducer and activator of transcription 5B
MTNRQHCGITEIGYNPDVPMNSKDFECSGGILNNSNILEYHEASGQMVCNFRSMQLKKIKRAEKKGTESVMDEKFILLFFTEFRIADDSFWPYSAKTAGDSRVKRGDLLFHILAFSLPVVVIVHGNQEAHAWATVTWHNAFATADEVLYKVPDRVTWRELGNVLSEKFRSATGRGLSQQNLKYLASKVYRNQADSDEILITWNQFSKEPLSDKSFTFWEWFHSIYNLTKEHLSPLWQAERIVGFVGKKGCVDLLLGSVYGEPAPIGTFLLRFSETELGGITIAWVSSSDISSMMPALDDRVQISSRNSPTNTSANVVMHLEPFYAKDLHTRALADRIRDLKDIICLYPNIPKDEAFEAYYSPIPIQPTPKSAECYVKSVLVTTLVKNYPGANSGAHTEASVTPNSVSQSSPDGYYQDNISMNDVMEPNFCPYGDFNYTIQ